MGNVALLHMNRLNKTESAIFVSLMCTLFPEDLHTELILSSLQLVLCHVAAVKRLPAHRHSADYIFSGLSGSLGSFCVILKTEALKPVLRGAGSVAPLCYCT